MARDVEADALFCGGDLCEHERSDSAPPKIWPACEPGEHTRQILAELGYTPSEIERLKDADVVGWPEWGGEDASARASDERQRRKLATASLPEG